ncbi:hypothetical protein CJ179_38750 [Rhodococcus sp. ACS1]|uniref:WhiB family transcriptional regulator n=1 Tax=Rhodococcus sp. ACS1 TaxID=2028570 RepID=UPI000BB12C8D|nr:hypothetical protein CJ179_38750 [Rhodococcus sp. ACS1]
MLRAKCRGDDYDRYESDNRGQGQAADISRACDGCPVIVNCARYALANENHVGMVWAGVPVPEMPNTKYYRDAVRRLELIARLPTSDEL